MNIKDAIAVASIALSGLLTYSCVGTEGRVPQIKKMVPLAVAERNWKILRYEGYQRGSWSEHGGKVWYHVANIDNPSIQYRVHVTLWNGELQWYYGQPENLSRVNVEVAK